MSIERTKTKEETAKCLVMEQFDHMHRIITTLRIVISSKGRIKINFNTKIELIIGK